MGDSARFSAPTDSVALLAAIVHSSDDAIVSKDLDGIITSWNPAAERLFGYSEAEAIGRSITMIIPRERLSEETNILNTIRRGERVEHFATVRQRKDGTFVDVSLTISPVRNASGQIVLAARPTPCHSCKWRVFNHEVRFAISDSGIGIAPEFHDQIFQIFRRLHREEYPGLGVGLSLVRRLIENHGGGCGSSRKRVKAQHFTSLCPLCRI